jgi:hypothetical protein
MKSILKIKNVELESVVIFYFSMSEYMPAGINLYGDMLHNLLLVEPEDAYDLIRKDNPFLLYVEEYALIHVNQNAEEECLMNQLQ